MFCPNCGKEVQESQVFCPYCGAALKNPSSQKTEAPQNNGVNDENRVVYGEQKSALAAGLLGIFLGGLGIHNFYLGYTGKAVAQLILGIFTMGISGIWGFIEGILILTGEINVDGQGRPLKRP